MAERNEILLNFQAITGIEDLATCIDILEHKDWDMMAAVSSVMPQQDYNQQNRESMPLPSTEVGLQPSHSSSSSSGNGAAQSSAFVDLTRPSDQSQLTNQVDLTRHPSDPGQESVVSLASDDLDQMERCTLGVYFQSRLIRLELPLATTIYQLKQKLEAETNVPVHEQSLTGWPQAVQDFFKLKDTGIQNSYHLRLERTSNPPLPPPAYHQLHTLPTFTTSPPPYPVQPAVQETGSHSSLPIVVGENVSNKTVHFSNSSSTSFYSSGAVSGTNSAGMNWSFHSSSSSSRSNSGGGGGAGPSRVVVAETGVLKRPTQERGAGARVIYDKPDEVVNVDSPSSSQYSDAVEHISSDEYEDQMDSITDYDGIFTSDDDQQAKAMRTTLAPKGCTDPEEVLRHLTQTFELRYGAMHPLFYVGSLSSAVGEATSGTALSGTRKPLFIYLHHDGSVLSNVFCSQLLCTESVVNYLSMNFITWAWDLTLHEHRLKLLKMVEESFGKLAKNSVDEIRADHLPVILIVYKVKGSMDIRNIVQGETNLDALMTTLITAVDDCNLHNEREAQEDRERLVRENMIAEQNRAFQESLDADREKERVKLEKERAEKEEQELREAQRESMSDQVQEEPPKDCQEKLCTFRIRYPDGQSEQRRFLARNTIKDLINFLGSKDFMMSEYRILTSFPRKDLSDVELRLSLEEAGLCPQQTLHIEEK